jgi:repressor LexA
MWNKNELTIKQKEVLEAIEWFINENGFSPTVRELCSMIGNKDTHTMHNKLFELEKKKYISTIHGKSRTIKILRGIDE